MRHTRRADSKTRRAKIRKATIFQDVEACEGVTLGLFRFTSTFNPSCKTLTLTLM